VTSGVNKRGIHNDWKYISMGMWSLHLRSGNRRHSSSTGSTIQGVETMTLLLTIMAIFGTIVGLAVFLTFCEDKCRAKAEATIKRTKK
jgi:hypothetical protein